MQRIAYMVKKLKQKAGHLLWAESAGFMRMIQRRPDASPPVKIGFYLDNSLFIHLGDQLFFEPVLRLLANQYDTSIRPTPDMTEYFTMSGKQVIRNDKIFDCDILVTREELLPDVVKKTRADIISINTLSNKMGYRISEAITRHLAQYVDGEIPDCFDFSPWKPFDAKKNGGAGKVILAPYVESGWFRVWTSDVERLSLQAKEYAQQYGFTLCLTGGKADTKNQPPSVIGNDFEDWRGRFSPYQFLQILAAGDIARVFTFDTFAFHAAFAYGIPVTVKIRRSFPKRKQFIENHFLPSYSCQENRVIFL